MDTMVTIGAGFCEETRPFIGDDHGSNNLICLYLGFDELVSGD